MADGAPALSEVDPHGRPLPPRAPAGAALEVSFFVPCYNEEPNVGNVLAKLKSAAGSLGLGYEILVFDDCSRDRTVEVVQRYRAEHPDEPVRLFVNQRNRGVARNFVEGAFQAHGRYYRLICGDDTEPIHTLQQILAERGKADIVVPCPTRIEGRALYRHAISRLYTKLVNIASGYRLPYYNGHPLYLRADVMRFHVEATGFGYQAEFLTRLLGEGRSHLELPIVSVDREGSESLNIRNFLSVGHSLLKIALRRLRVYIFK